MISQSITDLFMHFCVKSSFWKKNIFVTFNFLQTIVLLISMPLVFKSVKKINFSYNLIDNKLVFFRSIFIFFLFPNFCFDIWQLLYQIFSWWSFESMSYSIKKLINEILHESITCSFIISVQHMSSKLLPQTLDLPSDKYA